MTDEISLFCNQYMKFMIFSITDRHNSQLFFTVIWWNLWLHPSLIWQSLQLISTIFLMKFRRFRVFFIATKWQNLCFFHHWLIKIHNLLRKFSILFCNPLRKFMIYFWNILTRYNFFLVRLSQFTIFSVIIWVNLRLYTLNVWQYLWLISGIIWKNSQFFFATNWSNLWSSPWLTDEIRKFLQWSFNKIHTVVILNQKQNPFKIHSNISERS